MKHTPEQWAVSSAPELDDMVLGSDSEGVADCMGNPENARRIVACVNACAGIPTEALENVWQITIKYEEGERFIIFKTGEDT